MALLLYGVSGDIRDTLGNLSETEVPASWVALGRKKATNVVNAYLEASFPSSIPFVSSTDIPELVDTLTTDLAVFFIKRDKHPGPAPLSETVKEEYWEKPISMLEKIRDGEIRVPELQTKEGDLVMSTQSEYTPTFDESSDIDWEVDDDKLDDIDDSKD